MKKIVPLMKYVRHVRMRMAVSCTVKRVLDIVLSLILIVALSPLLLAITVIAALDTKGSAVFVQERMGRHDVPFKIFKFRTMNVAAPANVATYMLENPEQYLSPVGEFLRRTSLDELPQLFNILAGQMSFVGPRPVVLTESELLQLRSRNGASSVRPGMTGLSQVSGRDTLSIADKALLDSMYAHTLSLKLDLQLIWKTVAYVLKSKDVVEGANAEIAAPATERSA